MSTKAMFTWVLLALALGALTFVLIRSNGSSASTNPTSGRIAVGARLFDLAPSDIRRILITHADGSTDDLDRAPAPAGASIVADSEWSLRTSRSSTATDAATPDAWPVTGPSMQGLLRKLAECQCLAIPPKDAALGDQPTTVVITLRDGATRTLRLADRTIAGAGLIEIESRTPSSAASATTIRAIVNDELHRVFTNPGPRAWRERSLFASITTDASRIKIENPRQRLALAKVDGRWTLLEPVAAPADPAAVQRLLSALVRINIDDFLDDGAPSLSTGLESPAARISIESDRRQVASPGADPTSTVAALEVVIGAVSGASNQRVFASINESRLVLLDARALASLSLEPTPLLWPAPIRLPSADIGAIVIQPLEPGTPTTTFKRLLARWVRIEPDGKERLLAEQELRDAQSVAIFLTGEDRPAAPTPSSDSAATPPTPPPPTAIDPPPGYHPLARLDLRTLGDAPLETLEVGTSGQATLTIRTRDVYRTYPLNRLPAPIALIAATRPVIEPVPASPDPTK